MRRMAENGMRKRLRELCRVGEYTYDGGQQENGGKVLHICGDGRVIWVELLSGESHDRLECNRKTDSPYSAGPTFI